MNLDVADRAVAVARIEQVVERGRHGAEHGGISGRLRSGRVGVALHTLKAHLMAGQHSGVYRAVRFVAIGAILNDRGMPPEKWSPSFRMAGVTIVIDAFLFKL